jgi:hypothetical protein
VDGVLATRRGERRREEVWGGCGAGVAGVIGVGLTSGRAICANRLPTGIVAMVVDDDDDDDDDDEVQIHSNSYKQTHLLIRRRGAIGGCGGQVDDGVYRC